MKRETKRRVLKGFVLLRGALRLRSSSEDFIFSTFTIQSTQGKNELIKENVFCHDETLSVCSLLVIFLWGTSVRKA